MVSRSDFEHSFFQWQSRITRIGAAQDSFWHSKEDLDGAWRGRVLDMERRVVGPLERRADEDRQDLDRRLLASG